MAVSFLSDNTAGNLIIVAFEFASAVSFSSISDTRGNKYALAGSEVLQTAGGWRARVYYAKNVARGSNTVTVTLTADAGFFDVYVHEYNGADKISPLDVTASSTGNSGTLNSGSATTRFDNDLIFGYGVDNSGPAVTGTGFTARSTFNGNITEDKTVTSVGSYNATATCPGCDWTMMMATFKAAVQGLEVSSRSDTLSDSRPSATSNHTVVFTTNTAVYGSSVSGSSTITLTFDAGFSIPSALDCGDVDAATSSQFNFNYPGCLATATAWGFSATGSVITLVPPSDTATHVATGTQITIKIGSNATNQQTGSHWITNPTSGGTYTISVGGTFGGSGNMLVSIQAGLLVEARVAETLSVAITGSTIGFVQSNSLSGDCLTNPQTLAFNSNSRAGDLIVVAIGITPSGVTNVSSIKDGNGNSYVLATSRSGTGVDGDGYIYYAKNISVQSQNPITITVTYSNTSCNRNHLAIHEYSGMDTSSPLDATSTNTGGGTALNSGSATTTHSIDLIFGLSVAMGGDQTFTPGSTFSARIDTLRIETEDRFVSATGVYSATSTLGVGDNWVMLMAAFKAAGSPCTADDGATVTQIATTATTVPFGTISANTFYQGCQDISVTTNAGGGYAVTVQESGPMQTSGGATIPDTTCDNGTCTAGVASAWTNATKYGFGHTCRNQTGSDCAGVYGNGVNFRPFASAGGGGSNINFVQGNAADKNSGCSGTTCAKAFTSNTTAGNLIVVSVQWDGTSPTSSVIDSQGNTFASAAGPVTQPNAGTPFHGQVWYAANIKGGADTVTSTFSAAPSFPDMEIHEYSGAQASNVLDQFSSATGTDTTLNSGSATTAVANELIFGYGALNSGSVSAGSGFNAREAINGNLSEDKISAAAGSYSATSSASGLVNWLALMATFKPNSSNPWEVLMASSTPAIATGRVKYRLSIPSNQAAGTYRTTITYTVTPTY